ncbi:MAG: penicillin-binding transpeptidase domain-containing protein [Polyangiales bacterium]
MWAAWLLVTAITVFVGVRRLSGDSVRRRAAKSTPAQRPSVKPPSYDALLRHAQPSRCRWRQQRCQVDLPQGYRATLTLDAGLQAHVLGEMQRFRVPYASLVALEPGSGRVLAYQSFSDANPQAGDLAADATPPAASVFKLVTAAALVDAGLKSDKRVCFRGGQHRIDEDNLREARGPSAQCARLDAAMGLSLNAVFAKLALRHLSPRRLQHYADAFAFGQRVDFALPYAVSPARVPSARLEFARAAAGFWHSQLSPLHGALLAATFADGGAMPVPLLVAALRDHRGRRVMRGKPRRFRQVVSAATAAQVAQMMVQTVRQGTAYKAFHDGKGVAFLPGIDIAGKTGSLNASMPYRAYSWWVGFAPARKPKIAVAALVVNTPKWRIKASYLAREALRYYLIDKVRQAQGTKLAHVVR